jgi:hypothetical protein
MKEKELKELSQEELIKLALSKTDEIKRMKGEFEDRIKTLTQKNEELNGLTQLHNAREDTFAEEKKKLTAEIEALQTANATLQTANATLQTANAERAVQNTTLDRVIQQKGELSQKNAELSEENQELRDKLEGISGQTIIRLIEEKKTLSEENSELQIKANFADRMIAKQKQRVVKALEEEKTALGNIKFTIFKEDRVSAKLALIEQYIKDLNDQDTQKTVETLLSLEEKFNANDEANPKTKLQVLCSTTSNIKRSSNTNKTLRGVLQKALETCRIYQEATTTTEARRSISHK